MVISDPGTPVGVAADRPSNDVNGWNPRHLVGGEVGGITDPLSSSYLRGEQKARKLTRSGRKARRSDEAP
eukprot:9327089-Pyramimonas_sp.AAC.1